MEPGSFTADQPLNATSLRSLKELVQRHPAIEVRLGHQPLARRNDASAPSAVLTELSMKRSAAAAILLLSLTSVWASACGDDESACADDPCGGGGNGSGASDPDGPTTTAGPTTTTTSTGTANGPTTTTGSQSTGSSMDEATIKLTFTGCSPSFDGDLVVVSNQESVAISTTVAPISSLQLDLHQTSGTIQISTAERVATGDVINLVTDNSTWTNISSQMPDPIGGTLTIATYEEQAGVLDLTFDNVVLENVQGMGLCTIDGTVTSTGTSF